MIFLVLLIPFCSATLTDKRSLDDDCSSTVSVSALFDQVNNNVPIKAHLRPCLTHAEKAYATVKSATRVEFYAPIALTLLIAGLLFLTVFKEPAEQKALGIVVTSIICFLLAVASWVISKQRFEAEYIRLLGQASR